MANIGFIGTGEIAAAMVAGLAGRGHNILVSERNADVAMALAARHSEVAVASNDTVVAGSDTIFLCLMAKTAKSALPRLQFRAHQVVISVMVDVSVSELQSLCAPARDIALTIPLSSVADGGSALPVYPDNASLRALFGERNLILPVKSEAALNAYFGASALASPILEQMQTGARWLAEQTGDERAAEAYVAAVFAGFLRSMALNPGLSFNDLLASLSTEGGLNATLRGHMNDHGAQNNLRDGLNALAPRLGLEAAKSDGA